MPPSHARRCGSCPCEAGLLQCGSQTTITGYTEWLAQGQLALTLGWDWELSAAQDGLTAPKRLELPRTNISLMNAQAPRFNGSAT